MRWKFFPQTLAGWIAAVLLAAACLACDWFFYQRRVGGKFFAKPDWARLFQWRWTLADLLELICLLSVLFMLREKRCQERS